MSEIEARFAAMDEMTSEQQQALLGSLAVTADARTWAAALAVFRGVEIGYA